MSGQVPPSPDGQSSHYPHGLDPYGRPYQNSSAQNDGQPYQPTPYPQSPYQPTPYQQSPYQPTPYQQSPYQPTPYQQSPYQPQGTYTPVGTLQPLAGRARLAIIFEGLAAIGMIVLTGSMAGVSGNSLESGSAGTGWYVALGLGLLLLVGGMIGGFVGIGLWLSRARANADLLNPTARHTLSPAFAWVGWIIPFASLVLPFLFLRDVRKAVAPQAGQGLLIAYWVTWVASSVISSVSSRAESTGSTVLGIVDVVSAILFVAAYVLSVLLLRTMTREQEAVITQAGFGVELSGR